MEEIGAPSMYQTTKIWYEGKNNDLWREIHEDYYKQSSVEYITFYDWLKENYEAPKKL